MKTPEEIKKRKKKQTVISVAILVFGTIAAYLILGPKSSDNSTLSAQVAPAPAALVETLRISEDASRVAKIEKIATLEVLGGQAEAVAEFSGRIQSVSFEAGDAVSKGQVLAVFDQSNLKNSPKVAFESARRSFGIAEENLSDTEDLVDESVSLAERAVKVAKLQKEQEEKAGTDEDVDIAKQNIKIAEDRKAQAEESGEIQKNTARLQLEQTRSALDQARIAFENTFIKSPIAGTIVSKNVNMGDFLNPGQAVASVVGTGKLQAVVFLNRDEIERIKEGDTVEIKIDGQSNLGRIVSYSKIANDGNSRYEVKISSNGELANEANRTAQVVFTAYLNGGGGFFVPLSAVNIGQNKKEVFVVKDGKAAAKTVELGKIIGTQIEVVSGLFAGDELIVENSRNLADGQSVRVE